MERLDYTQEEKALLEEYIVLEDPNWSEKRYISKRNNFEWVHYCACYNNYGQKLDHEEICGVSDDEKDLPEEEQTHVEALAYTYWDGRNWKSIIIDGDYFDYKDYEECSEKVSLEILKEMPAYPYINGVSESIETENYTYIATRYADFAIFTVEEN